MRSAEPVSGESGADNAAGEHGRPSQVALGGASKLGLRHAHNQRCVCLRDVHRYTNAVKNIQVPRLNDAHLGLKGHAQSMGRMGTVGMDREARAEMDTRGWHRAIGQLPNITDLFHNSLLTQLQPPLPPGSSSKMPDMLYSAWRTLPSDIFVVSFLPSCRHQLKIHLLNESYSDIPI